MLILLWPAARARAQDPLQPPARAASAASAASTPHTAARVPAWVPLPRLRSRLRAADIGLVINRADPASVQVGEHYIAARGLRPEQVLRVELPVKANISRDEFERLRAAVDAHFGNRAQALALAWSQPYGVECNSITGALTMGFDAALCTQLCGVSRPSRLFNSPVARPWAELGMRPAMLLAGRTVEQAKALIDRGVAADAALAGPGHAEVRALFLTTDDAARGVRTALYPPPGPLRGLAVRAVVAPASELNQTRRVLLAITGSLRVQLEPAPDWAPGGLGDHLTSFGGDLQGTHGHSTVLDWLASGAVASHGAVTEPCNFPQKFPHPQVLLGHYVQGATAIEAYWKSVAWPQQSLFVGEPLAAPFAPR